jgi:acyl-coenzyme A thioesterase PaaI-like protein
LVDHQVMEIIRSRLGARASQYRIPPPVFEMMRGEFLEVNLEAGLLRARFPILESYLNPFGVVQGGMVAAAVDNTVGPLSMLVAPPNVTRRMQLKFSRPATLDMGHLIVEARLRGVEGRWLTFSAAVRAPQGALLARATSVHWITGVG